MLNNNSSTIVCDRYNMMEMYLNIHNYLHPVHTKYTYKCTNKYTTKTSTPDKSSQHQHEQKHEQKQQQQQI